MILNFLKLLILIIIFSAIATLGYFVYKQEQSLQTLKSQPPQLSLGDIESLVDEKIAAIKFPSVATGAATITIIQKITTPAPKITAQPKEYIITLGSGTISETEKWVDIPSAQASINSDNYPGLKAAYFEVAMHIPNAQGEMRAKLVETTLPFYYGEILKTQSGTDVTLSTPMFLKSGNRNYRVQLYNQIGTAVLDSARIRIITQ